MCSDSERKRVNEWRVSSTSDRICPHENSVSKCIGYQSLRRRSNVTPEILCIWEDVIADEDLHVIPERKGRQRAGPEWRIEIDLTAWLIMEHCRRKAETVCMINIYDGNSK